MRAGWEKSYNPYIHPHKNNYKKFIFSYTSTAYHIHHHKTITTPTKKQYFDKLFYESIASFIFEVIIMLLCFIMVIIVFFWLIDLLQTEQKTTLLSNNLLCPCFLFLYSSSSSYLFLCSSLYLSLCFSRWTFLYSLSTSLEHNLPSSNSFVYKGYRTSHNECICIFWVIWIQEEKKWIGCASSNGQAKLQRFAESRGTWLHPYFVK